MTDSPEELELIQRAERGDQDALNQLFETYRERLKRMVRLRMNPHVQGRLDASDVVQDTYLEAARVLDKYLEEPALPFYLWLRKLTGQKIIQAHRHHMGAQKRAAGMEVSIHGGVPAASSESIAGMLSASITSPSRVVMRDEAKQHLEAALMRMNPLDREVLILRHFEQLTGPQTAQVLEITHDAVKKRYVRALDRLQTMLEEASSLADSS